MKSPYEFWNEKLLSLSSTQFEELCFDIIKATGQWRNVQWRKGGSDKGRDIVAEKISTPDGRTTIVEKWFFQCKRYESGIPQNKISEALDWAHAENADYIVIISNNSLTTDCHDYIDKRRPNLNPKVICWTDKNFVEFIQSFKHVLAQYFPDDVELTPLQKPGKVFELVLNIPEEKRKMLAQKLASIASQEPRRTKETLQLIDKEILEAGLVADENLKALIYQQFSAVLASKNEADAIEYLKKALEISPRNKLTMHQLAYLLFKKKEYEDALYYCDKILDIDPTDKFALNNRGSCLQALGRKRSAQRCFEMALGTDPNFVMASKNLALHHMHQGEYLKAANTLINALKTNKNHIILDTIGVLFKELGAYELAAAYHDLAIKQAPFFDEPWNNKGVALEHQSRSGEIIDQKTNAHALQCFQKVVELNPTKALGWANTSVCQSHRGDYEAAEKNCEKALELAPDDLTAIGQKSTLLHRKGESEEALRLVNDTITKNKDSNVVKNLYRTKAFLLRKMGRIPAAIRSLDEGLKIFPKAPELLFIKAELLQLTGQNEKAQKVAAEAEAIEARNQKVIDKLLSLLKGHIST